MRLPRALARRSARRQEEDEGEERPAGWRRFVQRVLREFGDELLIVGIGAASALVRAMGVTVETGQTGLLFTFGRAHKTLPPGFRVLAPFVQSVRKLPTRSRSMDLPAQRVATFEGLVYHADANLVYRIVDVFKAVIEIDDLEKGMRQMLGLGVQEVLRTQTQRTIQDGAALSRALVENLSRRLEPWGVAVERAGFPSITPSPQSLRVTQIARITGERGAMLRRLEAEGLARDRGLALLGTRVRLLPRTRGRRAAERQRRRALRLRKALLMHGWMPVRVKQAGRRLFARAGPDGKLRIPAEDKQKKKQKGAR